MNWFDYVDTALLTPALFAGGWMVFHKPRFHEFNWWLRLASLIAFAFAQSVWSLNYFVHGEAGLMAAKSAWVIFNALVVTQLADSALRGRK